MDTDSDYCLARNYSYIPGLQSASRDTFRVTKRADDILIEYTSEGDEFIREEKALTDCSFEKAKALVMLLLENAFRQRSWVSFVEDNYDYLKA